MGLASDSLISLELGPGNRNGVGQSQGVGSGTQGAGDVGRFVVGDQSVCILPVPFKLTGFAETIVSPLCDVHK